MIVGAEVAHTARSSHSGKRLRQPHDSWVSKEPFSVQGAQSKAQEPAHAYSTLQCLMLIRYSTCRTVLFNLSHSESVIHSLLLSS